MKKYKVALLFICLNPPYWPYAKDAIESARKHFLPGHDTDFFLWSDMPPETSYGATVFETEPVEWPLPTLFRYHLFLQQEERLREYDYVFYCDADMLFVDTVGEDILGETLTAAQHPMYALRESFYAPFEPNPESAAYIPLQRYYFAGGFQGGKSEKFIEAMKNMRKTIDSDFKKNYVARWNDESHWNKYLYTCGFPITVLTPSYVYPDSLIQEYYLKVWGQDYPPKIVTLTKKFTTSKEAGDNIKQQLQTL